MLNALRLAHWTVTAYEETEETVRLAASYDLFPEACPKCGTVNARFYRHGSARNKVTDAPAQGKPCTIEVTAARLKCRECNSTFIQPMPDLMDGYMMTKRCVQYIHKRASTETWAKIGRDVGVDEKTVRTVAAGQARQAVGSRTLFAPLILGIDELRLDGELRAIFVDGGYRRVLDILETNDKRLVNHWLSWLPGRERIRIVTMDMYGPYRDVVQHLLPNATIVVDRWHVQKKINEALDQVRVRVSRSQRTKKAKMAVLRKRKLLQISKHKLQPHVLVMLQAWLRNNPILLDAWCMKELFYEIWDCTSRADAECIFDNIPDMMLESVAEEFGRVYSTISNWRELIFPYFDARFTNAYTEAANGIVKIANRAGRGYSFEQIRARALSAKPLGKKHVFVCEECLKRYPVHEGWLLYAGRSVCPECDALHILHAIRQPTGSTETSG